jgi:transcriptional regulator with XRE-family HTH domain
MPDSRQPASPLVREFGDRVRARRYDLDLSQEALAHRAGLQRAYIGQLETGMRSPGLETLAKLARALELDAADLVRGLQKLKGRQ